VSLFIVCFFALLDHQIKNIKLAYIFFNFHHKLCFWDWTPKYIHSTML